MFRKVSILTGVILVFLAYEVQAARISVSWDGGGDGRSWADANNWDPNIVPDNNESMKFYVTIDSNYAGVNEIEVGLRQSRDVNQVDCYGVVELKVWPHDWQKYPVELTLVEPNGLTNHGELELWSESYQMGINGNLTNTGGATLEFSQVEIDANLYNLAGATILLESENDVQGDLQNEGAITIIPASDLLCSKTFHNTRVLNLYDGECGGDELFDNDTNGIITGFGVVYTEQLFQNKGEIIASGGSLAVSSEGAFINMGLLRNNPPSSLHIKPAEDVNNNGTIEVHAGGGIGIDCNVVNVADANIYLLGGTLAAKNITQQAGATFEGFGGISVADKVLIESGAKIELTGPTNVVGDVNIPAGATLEISDGQTLITGHTTCDGTIHLIGGTVIFQGGCDCDDCNIINEAGIDRNYFDINADGIENFEDFAYFADTWLWQASWY